MLSQLISVITIMVALYLVTNYKSSLLHTCGLLAIGLTVLYILTQRMEVVEHLQISGEAVQNVGSIYNKDNMLVKNIKVTDNLEAGNLVVASNVRVGNANLIMGGFQDKNRWIIHAPNDDRKGMWIAPGNGTDNWDWGKGVSLSSTGVMGIGNGWSFDATDGHLRFKYNGEQKMVIHNDGKAWSANEGYMENKIGYGDDIKIHGNRGLLDNWGGRCNAGDRDRDVGMGCSEGIGKANWIWRITK